MFVSINAELDFGHGLPAGSSADVQPADDAVLRFHPPVQTVTWPA
jgi:hypothetical protein